MSYTFNPFIGNLDNTGTPSQYVPSTEDFSIDTDLVSYEKSVLLGNIGVLTKVPATTLAYQSPDGNVVQLSGTGNGYSGDLSFTIGPIYSNNYITFNNLNHIDGNFVLSIGMFGLTAINFPNLQSVTSDFFVQGNANMRIKEAVFPELLYVGGYLTFGVGVNNQNGAFIEPLETINFPELIAVGNTITIGGYGYTQAPVISSMLFPKLESINGSIFIGGSIAQGEIANRPFVNLQTIDFSNLKFCAGSIRIQNVPNLTSFTLSSLEILNSSPYFPSCSALQDVSFPNLQFIGGYSSPFSNTNTHSLTSISMPNLVVSTANITQYGTTASLRNFEFGTDTLKHVYTTNSFTVAQTLTQQSVDNLLKAFARLDGTNGTTLYAGSLNLGGSNSAPSYTSGVTITADGANFTRVDTTVTALVTSHGYNTGDIVTFIGNGASALNGTYSVTATNVDEFQYTTPTSGSLTGSATVSAYYTTEPTDGFKYFQTIALRGTTVTINYPA